MKFLLLDDIRDCTMTYNLTKNTIYIINKWDIVKNYNEFVKYIQENGLPDVISFDHDLADEHYVPCEYWDNYQLSKDYQDGKSYSEKTGNDCAKWLVQYCIDSNLSLPQWLVHSANPVGADYIRRTLKNYK